MKLRKILATLILSVATLGAFACWLPTDVVSLDQLLNGRREWQRFFYLSGVNSPGNHISGITYTVNGNDVTVGYTAVNHQTVYLPLTVYVGVADICGGSNAVSTRTTNGAGAEYEKLGMLVQYRVLPDTTWHTAASKSFTSGDLALVTKKKLFGSAQIDCEASAGSVILIRIYIAVWKYWQLLPGGTGVYTPSIENCDPDSAVISASSDIAASESNSFYVAVDGANTLKPGLTMASTAENGNSITEYQDGWTPQFVMAVTVGNKRRPGK